MAVAKAVVQLRHPSLGGQGSNTWHFRWDGDFAGGEDQAETLMGLVENFYTLCAGFLPDTLDIVWDGAVSGLLADEGSQLDATGWSNVGTAAGGPLPPANCVCVGWRTSTGGRSGRGRTFLGPLRAGMIDADGTIDAARLGEARTAAAGLVSDSREATGMALGVFSVKDQVLRDFTGSAVRDQFAVLRSRRD